jgi:hypothetical protein
MQIHKKGEGGGVKKLPVEPQKLKENLVTRAKALLTRVKQLKTKK